MGPPAGGRIVARMRPGALRSSITAIAALLLMSSVLVMMPSAEAAAPTITFTSPEADATLNETSVDVEWTTTGSATIDHYAVYLDDVAVDEAKTDTSIKLTGLSEGRHQVKLVTYYNDGSPNTITSYRHFIVDLGPPTLEINYPADGSYVNAQTVNLGWTSNDNGSTISKFRYVLDGAAPQEVNGDVRSVSLDLVDGQHTVRLTAVDELGNSITRTTSFFVDTKAPVVSISAPREGGGYTVNVAKVEWTGYDPGNPTAASGIEKYEIWKDDVKAGDYHHEAVEATLTFVDGVHTVRIVAFDKAGNTASSQITFLVDTGKPELDIITPQNGAGLDDSTAHLRWTASDISGIDHFTYELDGAAPVEIKDGTLRGLDLGPLTAGNHSVTLTAYDALGNSMSRTVSFEIKQLAVLSVTTAVDGKRAVVNVTYSREPAEAWLIINNNDGNRIEATSITGPNATFELSLDYGREYTITAHGKDSTGSAGASGEEKFSTSKDVTGDMLAIIGIVAAIIAVIVVLLIYLWNKRKNGGGPQGPQPKVRSWKGMDAMQRRASRKKRDDDDDLI